MRRYVFYDEISRFRVVDNEDETNYLNVVEFSDETVYKPNNNMIAEFVIELDEK